MLTQKQWKIQYLAERMNNLALNLAAESARQIVLRQHTAHEQAIIAEEARNIAVRLLEAVEAGIYRNLSNYDFDKIAHDMAKRTSFLALNAAFVSCKIPELMPVAVFAEELLNIWRELTDTLEVRVDFTDIPVPSPRSTVIPDVFYLFQATSGNITWCENARLVMEVLGAEGDGLEYVQGNRYVIKNNWRDLDVPFINLGEVSENPGIIIIADASDRKKQYAVYASVSVHGLVNSYVGVSQTYSGEIPVRECWLASDGSELIFPDWEKLSAINP